MPTNKVNVVFNADAAGFHRVLGKVESGLTGLKGKIAGALGVASIGLIVNNMLEFGESIQTVANNLDVSTDTAQKFTWAARNANIEVGVLAKTMNTLDMARRKFLGGDTKKGDLLKQLGLSEEELKTIRPDEMLYKVLERSKNKPRNYTENIFNQLGIPTKIGGKVLGAREDILNKNIPLVSGDMIEKLDMMGDAFDDVKIVIMEALIPAFISLVRQVVSLALGLKPILRILNEIEVLRAEAQKSKEIDAAAKASLPEYLFHVLLSSKSKRSSSVKAVENWQKENKDEDTVLFKIIASLEKFLLELNKKKVPKLNEPYVPGTIPIKTKSKPEKYTSIGELGTNEFLKIGGTLGMDLNYRLMRLSIEANNYLKRIAEAVENIDDATTANMEAQEFALNGGD